MKRYTLPAMALHWLMAALILVALPLGLTMVDLPLSPHKLQLYAWHKWIGITVLGLWGLRVIWRLTHIPPAMPAGMPRWQHEAAEWTHRLLYLLMVLIPLTGWMMSSALGFSVVWLGLWKLPDMVAPNHALGETLKHVHAWLNDGLMAAIGLHLVAVLQHQFIMKDHLLRRMLPGRE